MTNWGRGPVEPAESPADPALRPSTLALGWVGVALSPTFLPTSHSALISPARHLQAPGCGEVPQAAVISAFRVTLVPGAGWQEAEPLQGLWERQSQMGSRAGACRPQAGPGMRAPGCSTWGGGAGTMQEPQGREQALH